MIRRVAHQRALGLVFLAATAHAATDATASESAAATPSTDSTEPILEPYADPRGPSEGWAGDDSAGRLNLTIPLWLPFLALESSLITESDDTETLETESAVAWVMIGSLEAGYKQLAARVDVFGIGFTDQLLRRNGMTTDVTVESSGFVGRGLVMYEFGPWRLNKAKNQAALAPVAGARYNRIAFETGERADLEGTYDWIDPLVGLRSEFRFGDVRLGAHVDVGGFTVGSDLAFWAAFTAEYMFTSWFAGWAGWQHYQVLFRDTNKDQVDTLELLLTGPSTGVSFYIL